MKRNDASAPAAFRRCSPTAWRSAFSAALALVLVVSCGSTVGSGGAVSPTPSTRSVAFTEITYVAYGRHDSGPAIIVGANDQSRATLARLVDGAKVPDGRVAVAAFQGQQTSGGFSIHIERIERRGDQLLVHATFSEPAPGSMNTMALTSPVHVVSIAASDARDLKDAVLLDETGSERARSSLT
jgi:protease stability complex PrcB-like protein